MRSLSRKILLLTLIFPIFMEVFVLCKSFTYLYKVYIALANDQKYYVDFNYIFYSLNSASYAEDNKVYLKAKNKVMCHHLHMHIRCQYKILFGDKFFKQFLITFTLNA